MSPTPFDPAAYGPALGELLREPRLPGLACGPPAAAFTARLAAFAQTQSGDAASQALVAGLYAHFDFWDEAHDCVQRADDQGGWYWHAILHRREPDAGNAQYWFRRVERHPVVIEMTREPGYGSPAAFVKLCDRVRGSASAEEQRAKELQLLEWERLFDWCYRRVAAG